MGFYATDSLVETDRRNAAALPAGRRPRLNRKPHIRTSGGRGKFITDHLGTVHALTDESGDVVEEYRYDAWGRVLGVYDGDGAPLEESAVGNHYLFQGRWYSWELHKAMSGSGLYFFRARWYDPVTGRWLSKDPIGISGGLNQYVFCGNNPVNARDPSGAFVRARFNRSTGKLSVTEVTGTRETITVDAVSGFGPLANNPAAEQKPYGPIPAGSYSILDQVPANCKSIPLTQATDWFHLDPWDNVRGDLVHQPTGRENFGLHAGTSLGCVTVDTSKGCNKKKWKKIVHMLRTTSRVNGALGRMIVR